MNIGQETASTINASRISTVLLQALYVTGMLLQLVSICSFVIVQREHKQVKSKNVTG